MDRDKRCKTRTLLVFAALALGCTTVWGADWLFDGHDPQRTGWQPDEKIITTANAKNLKLLWKIDTGNMPKNPSVAGAGFALGRNLFPPLIVGKVDTRNGPKEIAILAGIEDNLYAIDVAKGEILWKKHFDSGQATSNCQTLAVPVITPAATPGKYTIYTISNGGSLHQLNVADGEDIAPPEKFLPPGARSYSLNLFKGVLYTVTGGNCGGHTNMVYGFDLATGRTGTFSNGSGGMWGIKGPAIGADGTVYSGTGDGVFDPSYGLYGNGIIGVKQNVQTKALEMPKYFGPSNAEYLYKRDLDVNVTPTIFTYKGKEYLVGSSKECKLWLLDTANFGGEDHRTAAFRTPLMCNEFANYFAHGVWGALANYVDSKGTQWVLTPFWGPKYAEFKAPLEYGPVTHGALAAFKVEEKNGKTQLTPAWISRDMNQADIPVIANGVVFGFGTGADTTIGVDDARLGEAQRVRNRLEASTHAIVYALDGETGKELWSSGDTIVSFNHQSGLTVANGKVYIGTYDGVEYCFGLGN